MADNATSPAKSDYSNVVLWLVFALTSVGTGVFFLVGLHARLSPDVLVASAALLGRTTLFVTSGLTIEALLLRAREGYLTLTKTRRSALHAYWVIVMLLCVALVVDVLLFAFGGYHLPTAGKILLSDGPAGVGQVVEATGLSIRSVLVAAAGLSAGIGVAVGLSKWTRRISARWSVTITRRGAVRALFITLGALALLELVATRIRDPYLWEREMRRVPLAFSFVRPRAELASFRVKVRPFAKEPAVDGIRLLPAESRPDVIIVIIESLRADAVTPVTMPRFSEFSRRARTFEHAITTGNVTHYAWYGLLCSKLPVYFDAAKGAASHAGSLALARLVGAGYRVHVLSTPDLDYQQLAGLVFGPLAQNRTRPYVQASFRPTSGGVAERDAAVVQEFARQLGSNPKGGHVYLVALDSSHFEYTWSGGFAAPFLPYARTVPITHDYAHDAEARRLVVNRYRNAVAWIDRLLGQMFDVLHANDRLRESIVVITGDHGEAFWEHETGTHGSSLTREQLEVGFALHLPKRPAFHSPGALSMLDVLPTILDELGLDTKGLDGTPLGDGTGSTSALTFQGWNEQAYHFALTLPARRLLFELDRESPLSAERLALYDVTDLRDVSLVGHAGHGSYAPVVQDLPAVLGQLRFLEL